MGMGPVRRAFVILRCAAALVALMSPIEGVVCVPSLFASAFSI
jgi:hypothetical protein